MNYTMNKLTITTLFVLIGLASISAQTSYHGLTTWYSPKTVAMAGGVGSINEEADRVNPAYLGSVQNKIAGVSFIQYPAGIQAKLINGIFPRVNSIWMVSLRHLNYGSFVGRDEDGNLTENYQSNDTWFMASVARNLPKIHTAIGSSSGLFISQLEKYESAVLIFTPGVVIDFNIIDAKVGLSVRNLGFPVTTYTDTKESLPTKLVGTFTKKLAHLPLEINLNTEYETHDEVFSGSVSGTFYFSYQIQFNWGISMNKSAQITHVDLGKDYLTGTGVGLSFTTSIVDINLGGYMYGTGTWISGVGIKLRL